MFIQITDPGDHTRILLNASCILMVRSRSQGGSAVYLSTSAAHHPDVLLAQESQEQIRALLRGESIVDAVDSMANSPVETATPSH